MCTSADDAASRLAIPARRRSAATALMTRCADAGSLRALAMASTAKIASGTPEFSPRPPPNGPPPPCGGGLRWRVVRHRRTSRERGSRVGEPLSLIKDGRFSYESLIIRDLRLFECRINLITHSRDVGAYGVTNVGGKVDAYHAGLFNHHKVEVFGALDLLPKGMVRR